jgi:hypothetical protein
VQTSDDRVGVLTFSMMLSAVVVVGVEVVVGGSNSV